MDKRTKSTNAVHPVGARRQMRAVAVRFVRSRFDIVAHSAQELGIAPPELIIRSMRRNWTTACALRRRVCLNVKLVELPSDCVDYLIAHALCQTVHPAERLELLRTLQPDWEQRRRLVKEFEQSRRKVGSSGGI